MGHTPRPTGLTTRPMGDASRWLIGPISKCMGLGMSMGVGMGTGMGLGMGMDLSLIHI